MSTSPVNPNWARAKPPLRPKAISNYRDRNIDICCGISRLDFNEPARMPNTKNKMTGSKKLCIAIAQVSVKNLVQPRLFATALVTLAIAVVRVFKVGLVDAPCRWGGHCGCSG
jgi:hypothetical protein